MSENRVGYQMGGGVKINGRREELNTFRAVNERIAEITLEFQGLKPLLRRSGPFIPDLWMEED